MDMINGTLALHTRHIQVDTVRPNQFTQAVSHQSAQDVVSVLGTPYDVEMDFKNGVRTTSILLHGTILTRWFQP